MQKRIVLFAMVAFSLEGAAVAAAPQGVSPAPQPLTVNIDAGQMAESISKYEYGMFIEHIGPLIYRSLWSEMLDDRKFWFPITSKEPEQGQRPGGFRGMQLRKWRPVGPDEFVTLDQGQPFVGAQSPRIALAAAEPHGIRQSGLALVKGKRYVGHIWLRGTPGTRVKVALVWGAGSDDRRTVSIATVPAAYDEISVELHSRGRHR